MVQGSYVSENEATAIAASIAVTAAMNNNHKTLLMQLTDNKSTSALTILKGKEIAENTITELGTYQIEDKGIDALLRRASSIKLVKETFDSSTEPMLSYENYLDVADITKKNDFIKTLSVNGMKNILKYANDVYGMIIIILDGKNDQVMAEMLSLCDAYVTCVRQSPAPHALNTIDGKKSYYAVADFDSHSRYNLQFLKKIYNSNDLYTIPYNSEYHDAVISGTLLKFMLKNNTPEKEDDNSKLREAIMDLTEAVINDKVTADQMALEKFENENFVRDDDEKDAELTEVSNFEIETVTTTKGHFLKKAVEEEVLHIDDDAPKKKSKRRPFFRKKDAFDEQIREENRDPFVDEIKVDEDILTEEETGPGEMDAMQPDSEPEPAFEETEAYEEEPHIEEPPVEEPPAKKKKERRGLFGRKKKRADAAEYDFLVPDEDAFEENAKMMDEETRFKEEEAAYLRGEEIDDIQEEPLTKKTPVYTEEAPVYQAYEKIDAEVLKEEPVKIKTIRTIRTADSWVCPECSTENTGKFCQECGTKKTLDWTCPNCKTVNTGKFCQECGTKRG
jgi:hypothetical protein